MPPVGGWPSLEDLPTVLGPCVDSGADPALVTYSFPALEIQGEEHLTIRRDGLMQMLMHENNEIFLVEKTHEQDPLTDWSTQPPAGTTPQLEPVAGALSLCTDHMDTPAMIEHPRTGEWLLYVGSRPGTLYTSPTGPKPWHGVATIGWSTAIQVATRPPGSPPTPNSPWNFDETAAAIEATESYEVPAEEAGEGTFYRGGPGEPTAVWVPRYHSVLDVTGFIRVFYVAKTNYAGGPTAGGSTRVRRMTYADSIDGKTGFVKRSFPFWDIFSEDPNNPAHVFNNFVGPYQPNFCGDMRSDGVHVIFRMGSTGGSAGQGFIGWGFSPDWGDTWEFHPAHYTSPDPTPILTPISNPAFPEGSNLRTPTMAIDERFDEGGG